MPSIKVKCLEFGDVRFRKMRNLVVPIADRITIIAGHNGIGKSTILGLIANNSGLSSSQAYKSYFGKAFQANLFEIAYIDFETEYLQLRDEGKPLPEPQVQYLVNGTTTVTKVCSITGRSNSRKARVVARTTPRADFESDDGTIAFGPDAKVPLPTLYLGMTRVLPIGESQHLVEHAEDRSLPDADRTFIADFVNSVILGNQADAGSITSQGIRGTGKFAKHPKYTHDSRSVSLGQDSLGAIATALASFNRLQRDWPEYPGGLLIVDELDAGFHPHAIGRLVSGLRTIARRLNLQVIATTHSPRLIEALHPDGQGNDRAPDAVVYLSDTASPAVSIDQSLRHILSDMNLDPPVLNPNDRQTIKVYFEDQEAAEFFKALTPPSETRRLNGKLKVKLDPMPMSLGCQHLIDLRKHDPYFATVVAIVDADSPVRGRLTDHIVKLPGGTEPNGAGLSPERTMHTFLRELVANQDEYAETWRALRAKNITTDQINANLLDGGSVADRDPAKRWWRQRFQYISDWKLIEAWASSNAGLVNRFRQALEDAIKVVLGRLAQQD